MSSFCDEATPRLESSTFWVQFAGNPSDKKLRARIKGFLTDILRIPGRIAVLGPEERAPIRTVTSAYSVIEVWRRLVAAADHKVLRLKRDHLRAEGAGGAAARLFLKWEQEGERREGPAYSIVKVCTQH